MLVFTLTVTSVVVRFVTCQMTGPSNGNTGTSFIFLMFLSALGARSLNHVNALLWCLSLWLSIILGTLYNLGHSLGLNVFPCLTATTEVISPIMYGACIMCMNKKNNNTRKLYTFCFSVCFRRQQYYILRAVDCQGNNKTLKAKQVFSWMLLSAMHCASSLFSLHNFPLNFWDS